MFFDEIKEVEKSVNDLKTDLVAIKNGVEGSFDQLDDIAAHIIAVEATEESTGDSGGSEKTQIIVDSLLKGEMLPKIDK